MVVGLPDDLFRPTEDELRTVFPTRAQSLKTWGRTPGVKVNDPHWIGVHRQTPLHTDPAYPRYTHHLMLYVDDFSLRGMDKVECELWRGLYYLLDTHSPHQVYARKPEATWYVAVSIDSKEPLESHRTIERLIAYAQSAPFLTPDVLGPNNGGRPR